MQNKEENRYSCKNMKLSIEGGIKQAWQSMYTKKPQNKAIKILRAIPGVWNAVVAHGSS